MISAGRVLLMPKGAYDASTTYELLDIVSYNGSSYIAKGTTTGNLPTNTTYWQLSAYGGNAANVASNFAELETTSIAVAVHNVDDLFIDENSQLMITTQKINIGDSIVSGTNCDPTSVETLINNVVTYFANLDAADRKLKAIAEIEVQTDLHTLTIGEYFKSDTSFYVTNAPTGIDSEITAVFRLTVEAAYDDESALNAPMLLTLRTLNGKVYKQAYDGANWSSWAQEATQEAIEAEIVGTKGLIANVQATLTANKNYSAGEHFIYQYNEYELDSSVSSGSALVIGTNCHATGDVSSQIQTLDANVTSLNEAFTNLDSAVEVLEKNGDWRTGLRFKNLGTSFTSAQATALANGDLSEFWNGDYWVINGHTWRIVDNSGIAERRGDTVFHTNSNNKVTSLVIMPDSNLVGAEAYLIDNANDSGHGYADCAYRTRTDGKGKAQCKTLASNAFGSSHIATHIELMSTGRGANGATGWGWQAADVELPSEVNIYGHNVWAKSSGFEGGGGYNTGDRWGQFKLFELAPYMAINRSQNYWLRDIVSASAFAFVSNDGSAGDTTPSNPYVGLRPHFILV